MEYSDICITPLKGDKYKILKDIRYKEIFIEAGYVTNGADIPRIFWSVFPPNKSDYLPAVIIHDYLCDREDYTLADKYFEEILTLLGVGPISRFLLVSSVKIYHKAKYNTPL